MPYVIRFRDAARRRDAVHDLLRGEIVFQNANLEDLVLLKSDGYPTYHLANVVDDHLMEITHIMRGEEWIPTAPLHVRLYEAFGWEAPLFAHMPLILAPGGGKLSKRHGSTAMEEFRAQGYLPEALMNYLALLGWSFDGTTEIFSKQDLLEKFTLERVSPSPATFDYDKLLWFNQHYINHILTLDDLTARVIPFLAEAGMADPAAGRARTTRISRVSGRRSALLKDRLRDAGRGAGADELLPARRARRRTIPALLIPKKTEPAQALAALHAVQRSAGRSSTSPTRRRSRRASARWPRSSG